VVQLGGLVTVFSLGGFMLTMFRRDARHEGGQPASDKPGTGTKVNG
jgi:hypothetical protein